MAHYISGPRDGRPSAFLMTDGLDVIIPPDNFPYGQQPLTEEVCKGTYSGIGNLLVWSGWADKEYDIPDRERVELD